MKRIRLDTDVYEQGMCFSLTMATADRDRAFSDANVVDACLKELNVTAAKYNLSVFAYCFMPDHLHLLASAPEGVSMLNAVRHFKQLTSFRFRNLPRYRGEALWQRSFYDHALRKEEDINVVAEYIWANPVRAGLVADINAYPHWGSLVWNRQELAGSEDPDLRHRRLYGESENVGEGLQTLAKRS